MKTAKTVVVTGGGRGIGADISSAFYNAGYNVVIGSRKNTGLAEVLGDNAWFYKTDVKNPLSLRNLIQFAIHQTGRLDSMINNAGFSAWKPIGEIDEKFWNHMVDTNLKGTLFGCAAAAAEMGKGGCIINISSLAGKRGSANNSVYCATKFGVNGITQSLAKELGLRGIRVNAVCPVYVETEGLKKALRADISPAGNMDVDDYLKDFARTQSALGRLPFGTEIGNTCLFLSSEQSSAITGQCINVDCGVLPQ
jgi:NAD(P)-dependent dehydrogenase (short-subunit alcohol dehydrogenase family)